VFMDGSQQPTHIFTMSQHSSQWQLANNF
jgi:hypothetical protein